MNVRSLHPAAWIGFLLNCFFMYVLFNSLAAIDLSALPDEKRELMSMLSDTLYGFRFFYYGVLAAQAVALVLLAGRMPFGLGLAVGASIFMLPGSLVYLIGCALTHAQNRYPGFERTTPDYSRARFVFHSSAAFRMRTLAAASLGISLLFLFAGWLNLGVIAFGFSLAALYTALRARRFHALALFSDHFSLTPGVFGAPLRIPYESVQLATLHDDESIHFSVRTPQGTSLLVWSLRTVVENERRSALEELGAALNAHNVPME